MNIAQPKILIVDDEPTIRQVLTVALQDWGFDLDSADSAVTARKAFERFQPDAVLLDINLPDESGLELLRTFKRLKPEVQVIMITAEVLVANAVAALRGHADDFISKPINLAELRATLKICLASSQQSKPDNPASAARLLIVTDTEERLNRLKAAIPANGNLTCARSLEELRTACQTRQDVAIVDLPSGQLQETLSTIRASNDQTNIPLLVALNRIASDPEIAGLLPRYRAMPCDQTELISLARRRLTDAGLNRIARQTT